MGTTQARNEYLKKIRTVEQLDKLLGDGGEGYDITMNSSGEIPAMVSPGRNVLLVGNTNYTVNVEDEDSGKLVNDGVYRIPPIKKWPNEKIELPSGIYRRDYQKLAQAYAQAHIMDDDVFTTLDPAKFDVRMHENNPGDGRLRKDFAFYLEELHACIAAKMNVEKLHICSSFRTIARNEDIYSRMTEPISVYSPHTGAIAVDIGVSDPSHRYIIADNAYYMGFGGIGVGDDFVHIDIGVKGYWAYDGVPMYKSPDEKYA